MIKVKFKVLNKVTDGGVESGGMPGTGPVLPAFGKLLFAPIVGLVIEDNKLPFMA